MEGVAMELTKEERRIASAIENGRKVLIEEANALIELADSLNDSFDRAIDLIVSTTGRIVVTGVGKSGLVGRKIAATFSSTGSPSFFVHAAEAAHGDLGMIKPVDTLVIVSNSGSTAELRSVIAYAEVNKVPIIGIASRVDSLLIRKSTVPIVLPALPEACPEQLAPTTSTTMMLALGDALAIAAMRRRGVSKDLLLHLHPGGAIGFGYRTVGSLLDEDAALPLVRENSRMRDVVIEMTNASKGVAGVVDDQGFLVGVVSDGDLRRSFDYILSVKLKDIMTRTPKTVAASATIQDARTIMLTHKITAIFVMSGEEPRRPMGLLNIHDLSMSA
jgi:arabinose-5-phosphate isomerase